MIILLYNPKVASKVIFKMPLRNKNEKITNLKTN